VSCHAKHQGTSSLSQMQIDQATVSTFCPTNKHSVAAPSKSEQPQPSVFLLSHPIVFRKERLVQRYMTQIFKHCDHPTKFRSAIMSKKQFSYCSFLWSSLSGNSPTPPHNQLPTPLLPNGTKSERIPRLLLLCHESVLTRNLTNTSALCAPTYHWLKCSTMTRRGKCDLIVAIASWVARHGGVVAWLSLLLYEGLR
jgi:hypothetical protein